MCSCNDKSINQWVNQKKISGQQFLIIELSQSFFKQNVKHWLVQLLKCQEKLLLFVNYDSDEESMDCVVVLAG